MALSYRQYDAQDGSRESSVGRSHSPGSRDRSAAERTKVGAALDNERRPLPPIVRESFVTPAAVIREARQGCCVMLEAQLAKSSNGQERASAGTFSELGERPFHF